MALVKFRVEVRIDHKRLAKMIKKAIAKIDATPEDERVEVVCDWASRIANECVTLELDSDMFDVPKDS